VKSLRFRGDVSYSGFDYKNIDDSYRSLGFVLERTQTQWPVDDAPRLARWTSGIDTGLIAKSAEFLTSDLLEGASGPYG
jgi:hypothetical protein